MEAFSPILPSPRYLTEDEVTAASTASPRSSAASTFWTLSSPRTKSRAASQPSSTTSKLVRLAGLNERYLCSHRSPWYAQENRPPAPIVCTYLGRGDARSGRPFRFILNSSRATVANVYLAMYPTSILARAMTLDDGLIRRVWQVLNDITPAKLLGEGRVYGGGLHKLEPKELANVPVPEIATLLPPADRPAKQADLLSELAL